MRTDTSSAETSPGPVRRAPTGGDEALARPRSEPAPAETSRPARPERDPAPTERLRAIAEALTRNRAEIEVRLGDDPGFRHRERQDVISQLRTPHGEAPGELEGHVYSDPMVCRRAADAIAGHQEAE